MLAAVLTSPMLPKLHSMFLVGLESKAPQLTSECNALLRTRRYVQGSLLSTQEIVPVFRRAGSADLAEYTGKVLLGLEPAGDGDVQDAPFGRTQHLLRFLDPIPEETLVRSLTGRVAEDLGKMRRAEPNCPRHFLKA